MLLLLAGLVPIAAVAYLTGSWLGGCVMEISERDGGDRDG